MFWPRLSNAGLLLLMAALGGASLLPPGLRALVAQTCWEVPLCLHTRGRQSARTRVKFPHCPPPPHQFVLPDMPVMLAVGSG